MTDAKYTFFIAHAGADTERARALHALLHPGVPCFLDVVDLEPGDRWNERLPQAQARSRATVALISTAEEPHYRDEEIARAIAHWRKNEATHRVIPVYLDGRSTDPSGAPYGLINIVDLDAQEHGLSGVADRLRRIAHKLDDRPLKAWQDSRVQQFKELRVLGPYGLLPIEMDRAYVDLQLQPEHAGDGSGEPAQTSASIISLDQALARLRDHPRLALALIGNPGAGKTTLLRQLYRRTLAATRVPGLDEERSPVALAFRDLDDAHLVQGGLRQAIEAQARRDGHAGAAESLFDGRGLIILFDGLDEVANEERRVRICDWLEDEALQWEGRARFVITCRVAAWSRRREERRARTRRLSLAFLATDVLALDQPAVERFVRRWFPAAFRMRHPDRDEAQREAEAQDKATALLDLVGQPALLHSRLRALMTNPLLLSTVCLVYLSHEDLPERRAELFDWCLRLLIELRSKERDPLLRRLRDAPMRQVLQPLAWAMQARGKSALAVEDARAVITEHLSGTKLHDLAPADFIELAHEHAGVLSEPDLGELGFVHPSFREYLAARHAVEQGLYVDLAKRAGDDWWREVILLALAHGGALSSFVRALVHDSVLHEHADLVLEAARDAPRVPAEPFVEALAQARGPALVATVTLVSRVFEAGALPAPLQAAMAALTEATHPPEVRQAARRFVGQVVSEAPFEGATPGQVWREPVTGVTFVWIPPGEFRMGAAPGVPVQITQGFWIGQHPVTNEVYGRFLATAKHPEPRYWRNARFNKPDQPVVGVDFRDALAFCAWATPAAAFEDGRAITLPTEAQWEYTARAAGGNGHLRTYPWGFDEPTPELAVFLGSGGLATVGGRPRGATPLGVHDMAGNVWEWCLDAWRAALAEGADPHEGAPPESAAPRVVRGGSWSDLARYLRAADRRGLGPGRRGGGLGFRVVCVGSRQHA